MPEVAQFVDVRSLAELSKEEASLRAEYLVLKPSSTSPSPGELLRRSAEFLECVVVVSAFSEAMSEMGIRTVLEAVEQLDRITKLAEQVAGYSAEALRCLPAPKSTWMPHSNQNVTEIEQVTLLAKSILAACPVDALEKIGASSGDEKTSHRCRIAFDRLTAFVRRSSHPEGARGRAIGRAYSDGRLSLREVADALEMNTSDALVFLDEHGYARSMEKMALTNDERTSAYALLRRRRLSEERESDDVLRNRVRRNVLASQRIEGLDVRKWFSDEP